MPLVIDRSMDGFSSVALSSLKIPYEYPRDEDGRELDFRPGEELHERLKTEILRRVRSSRMSMQKKYDTWKEIDRTCTAFVPLDEEEKTLKDRDPKKPLSVVVPMSYAIKQTLETYMVSIFLQEPIFRYQGVGPEDIKGATLLEKLISQQCASPKAKIEKSLINMWGGAFAHGIGATSVDWKVVQDKRRIVVPDDPLNPNTTYSVVPTPNVAYEGNFLRQIDNYNFFPDPNVSIDNVQEGEFIGWSVRSNVPNILSREADGIEELFNAKYLKHTDCRSYLLLEGKREDRTDRATPFDFTPGGDQAKPADELYFYWNLVPKDWGLGPSEYPEKWLFILVGDRVLIQGKPLGLDHNMFPVAVAAPGCDGFTVTPTSELEIIYGMQHFMDFIFSTHIANRRKILNDMLVVDPSLVNMKDLSTPGPGKLIRMRRSAWGRGVNNAVEQLKVMDVTERSLEDANMVMSMMRIFSGAVDDVQGIKPGGERRSAAEFRGTQGSALSRLEKISRVIGIQSMKDIGYMFARHNQQLLSNSTYVKLIGSWELQLSNELANNPKNRVPVTLNDIMVDFDVNVAYGNLPGKQDPATWQLVLQTVAQNPVLSSQLDVVKIFAHMARLMGAEEISSFQLPQSIKTQVVSDTQAQALAQAGNIVPVGGQSAA